MQSNAFSVSVFRKLGELDWPGVWFFRQMQQKDGRTSKERFSAIEELESWPMCGQLDEQGL